MDLSVYLTMLFPYFGDRKGFGKKSKSKDGRGKAEYVSFILGAIVEEEWETECAILDKEADTLRKIMNGALKISNADAIFMNNHVDKERFAVVLRDDIQSYDASVAMAKTLADNGITTNGTMPDILSKCAALLEEIIAEAARPKGARDFSDVCAAAQKALERMPHPTMLATPTEPEKHEQKYIEALCAAYGDAEGVKGFSYPMLADFPEYDDDMKERRIDYFSAESIRRSIDELQGIEMQDQFSVLKSEVYAGVRNTALKRYDNGFDRMLSVMEQSTQTQVTQFILCRSPYWISNRIKQGVCHFLVNDGKLKWVK